MGIETPGGAMPGSAAGNDATGTMDPLETEYFNWDIAGSPVSIHMHLQAVDGIAREVIEGFGKLSRRVLEVGGLLLGRVLSGERPVVWVERFQRIDCEHRFGPQFILDSEDTAALEDAAAGILRTGELAVVGLYRSHGRPGFQLEESDFDLIRRYFSDPSDLILLIKPESLTDISGRFFAWDPARGTHPMGDEFPFRGRVFLPDTRVDTSDTAGGIVEPNEAEPLLEANNASPEQPRRLVPDFAPLPVEPSPSLYGLGGRSAPDDLWQRPDELTAEHGIQERVKKWLPLLAALLLVGGIFWMISRSSGHGASNPAPAQTANTERPLGLYVDPAGQSWRVLWNPNATALRDARSVQLFVREKDDQDRDDQNRIELSARDLASGSYEYKPVGNDVTFRLEVINRAGRVSAESFRLVRTANPVSTASPSQPSPAASKTLPSPATAGADRFVQPRAIYRAPPVVAAGVRPRIKGTIPIDIRVLIDTRGRVVSATPVTRQRTGLDEYLAGRAVQAARLWRFEPARANGKPVEGTLVIHFTFQK